MSIPPLKLDTSPVLELLRKATQAELSYDAMNFTQAASNAASALLALAQVQQMENDLEDFLDANATGGDQEIPLPTEDDGENDGENE